MDNLIVEPQYFDTGICHCYKVLNNANHDCIQIHYGSTWPGIIMTHDSLVHNSPTKEITKEQFDKKFKKVMKRIKNAK